MEVEIEEITQTYEITFPFMIALSSGIVVLVFTIRSMM